jgi:lipopolysaccharide/colanic/teichoic acid biosynthesis glycosyltransferase
VPYPERCDLELYYVYNWSLSLDFKILFLTLPSVLRGVGAH